MGDLTYVYTHTHIFYNVLHRRRFLFSRAILIRRDYTSRYRGISAREVPFIRRIIMIRGRIPGASELSDVRSAALENERESFFRVHSGRVRRYAVDKAV